MLRRYLFPARWHHWVGPALILGLALALIAIIVIAIGLPSFPATRADSPGVARLVHTTFKRSVAYHSRNIAAPAGLDDPGRIMSGAGHYGLVCSHCHGAPGLGQNPIAMSMSPKPQYLPAVVRQYKDAELFWILQHGIKYSAMPAWPSEKRDDEIWSMVAFLKRLPGMRQDEYRRLAFGDAPTGAAPVAPFGPEPRAVRYAIRNDDEAFANERRYATPVAGLDDIAFAQAPSATCARCHGADGTGRVGSRYPNIAMQDPRYIRATLHAFATGRRSSATMQTVASQLSPAQMEALARHYTARPVHSAETFRADAATMAEGNRIAHQGATACAGCHGAQGASERLVPAIEGQRFAYLIDQMKLFAAGGRGNSNGYNPMRASAHNLTPRQIAAVSAYYASVPPQ